MSDTNPTDPIAEASASQRPPEFVVTLDEAPAPQDDVAFADSISVELLAVLDSLRPEERLAFVLHQVFALPYEEIGGIIGESTDGATALASRARQKVQAAQRPARIGRRQPGVVRSFLAAARTGHVERLLCVLDPEVTLTVHTSNGPVVALGAVEVAARARMAVGAAQGAAQGSAATVNGRPGVVSWHEDGTPLSVLAFTVADGGITEITAVTDPAALAVLDLPHPA